MPTEEIDISVPCIELSFKNEEALCKAFEEYCNEEQQISGDNLPELFLNLFGKLRLEDNEKTLKKIEGVKLDYALYRSIVLSYLTDSRNFQWGALTSKGNGPVGFDLLTEQFSKEIRKEGIQYNIMVVGRSGLGKSTFINTLFKGEFARKSRHTTTDDLFDDFEDYDNDEGSEEVTPRPPQTTSIRSVAHVIEEKGVRVKLTITDTPGFADHVDNSECWEPIVEYICNQYESYLLEEIKPERKPYISDTRVHCLLYFVMPTGHCLKAVDVKALKRLSRFCNIIPLIAKADTLTRDELADFKKRINEDLRYHQIEIYPLYTKNEYSSEELEIIKAGIPYAVIGSDAYEEGKLIRKCSAGTAEIENPEHCDFVLLRDMLIRNEMLRLIKSTKVLFYESFRKNYLLQKHFKLGRKFLLTASTVVKVEMKESVCAEPAITFFL